MVKILSVYRVSINTVHHFNVLQNSFEASKLQRNVSQVALSVRPFILVCNILNDIKRKVNVLILVTTRTAIHHEKSLGCMQGREGGRREGEGSKCSKCWYTGVCVCVVCE